MQKSLLDQMTNKLRETEEHLKQEMANRVSHTSATPPLYYTITIGASTDGGEYSRDGAVEEERSRATWGMLSWHRLSVPSMLLQQEVKRSVEPLVTELNKIQQEKVAMEQVIIPL